MKYLLLFGIVCYLLYNILYLKENRGNRKRSKSADTRMSLWLLVVGIVLLIAWSMV